jgi:hypothetical protein
MLPALRDLPEAVVPLEDLRKSLLARLLLLIRTPLALVAQARLQEIILEQRAVILRLDLSLPQAAQAAAAGALLPA